MPLVDADPHSTLDWDAATAKPKSQVTLTIHAVVVALYALVAALAAWFPDILNLGRQSTERQRYINSQADDVVWWALSTALVALILRFAPRWSTPAILVWVATLLNARPWSTPPPAIDARDLARVTIWSGWFLLALVVLSIILGLRVARRAGRPAPLVAAGFAAAVVALLSYSAAVIHSTERSEQPFPTDHGRTTLQELQSDPFWESLEQSPLSRQRAEVGTETPWGEEPSEVSALVLTESPAATFDDLVQTAKDAGWQQIWIYCNVTGTSRRVLLQKQLPSSPATISISEAGYSDGVSVRIRTGASDQEQGSDDCP